MRSAEVRETFLEFFKTKLHHIVPSAPMVIKDDPTLMFTNAGMNQFKNFFLGSTISKYPRVADTQKCLRVSGKHNDLEEVGHDTYHHTMFEMLGNWSFGDYFKKEAIAWGWELLTCVYGINPDDLYVTVFEGDKNDKLPEDSEAFNYWKAHIPEDRILYGNKKDNFWEMGDTGPCGPCSEVHVDIRTDTEKKNIPGRELINKDHPEVIEIWNLVFIEFNRTSNGELKKLPARHVDTGMGFERLCMVLQGKRSNYDTDVFQPLITRIEDLSGRYYGTNDDIDIAMRVIADHVRAVSFAISDGQLPSNTGAGYVIRRILRRAVRYGYTFLGFSEPFINRLVPILAGQMKEVFPELEVQDEMIRKVITEEETAFLRTLSLGIRKFDHYISTHEGSKCIDGNFAFELFDTYGFPIDLTGLMARENGWTIDMDGFNKGLKKQKDRSRNAAVVDTSDWIMVRDQTDTEFIGYSAITAEANIIKYRKVVARNKQYYEIILDITPFYAESGGQVGDTGTFYSGDEKLEVINTVKENNQIVHRTTGIFSDTDKPVKAVVNARKRDLTANNHTATHLLHAALKEVLGEHVEQKGSLVDSSRLRFDFSHFTRLSDEDILKVDKIVNRKIRENIQFEEMKDVSFDEARAQGAVALFGEKYGEKVRVVIFDKNFSIELCGGTHVEATGQIGFFKIISESAIAAGIRRIEAITAEVAEDFVNDQIQNLSMVKEILKIPKDIVRGAQKLVEEKNQLHKQLTELKKQKISSIKHDLKTNAINLNGINFIAVKLDIDMGEARDLAFSMNKELTDLFIIIGTVNNGKANLTLMISENLIKEKGLNASVIIRDIATEINGGGGGQEHFATAGGKNINGLENAFSRAKAIITAL